MSGISVTVIVVSYRTRELTLRMLDRLRSECTGHPYEVLVVDNASDDGSAEAVRTAFPSVRVERLAANVGFARAVNHAVALAGTDWLLLLNPDTEPVGDVIAELVSFAQAHPGHGIYTGRTLRADGVDDARSCHGLPSLWSYTCYALGLSTLLRRSRWFNPEALPGLDRRRVSVVPAVSGCLMLVDRSLFVALKGFAPDYFMYSEDIDLCARAGRLGARPLLDPAAAITHVGGASSSTAGKRMMVLCGKCTYLRLRWSPARAAAGRALLAAGVALRAAGAVVIGNRRGAVWREVWRERARWLGGWPASGDAVPGGVTVDRVSGAASG